MAPIEDVADLPRVLLIGDSISIGYTLPVRKKLEGKANVHRPPTNCGPTTRGVEQIDAWIGDGKWDIIHFNWGLHDLKYIVGDKPTIADPKAKGAHQQVIPENYEKNLRLLVDRLKKTGAKLIWRNTTPVPEGAKGRIPGDSAKYNEIAAKIMEDNDIPTNDLFALSKSFKPGLQRNADVHYTAAGSNALADSVVESIEARPLKIGRAGRLPSAISTSLRFDPPQISLGGRCSVIAAVPSLVPKLHRRHRIHIAHRPHPIRAKSLRKLVIQSLPGSEFERLVRNPKPRPVHIHLQPDHRFFT